MWDPNIPYLVLIYFIFDDELQKDLPLPQVAQDQPDDDLLV